MRTGPNYAGGFRKGSFISRVRPSVHGAFRIRSSILRKLKRLVFRFGVHGKQFEKEAFRKRWHNNNHDIPLPEFSSNTNVQMRNWPVIVACLNSSGEVWTEDIWRVFRVKALFWNFSGLVRTLLLLHKSIDATSAWRQYDTSCNLVTRPMKDKSNDVIDVNAPSRVSLTYRLRHVAMEFKERQMQL